jgi:hypothetical protein
MEHIQARQITICYEDHEMKKGKFGQMTLIPEGIWIQGRNSPVFASLQVRDNRPVIALSDHDHSSNPQNGHQFAISLDEKNNPFIQLSIDGTIFKIGATELRFLIATIKEAIKPVEPTGEFSLIDGPPAPTESPPLGFREP